ncbi:DUF2752 domain-containing protein [Nocardioides sp. SYSU D00038]|uniref:DUF2752 domain-containing protein n=1 Tax=Nocardioides sp. SYSU D00038 TaxID=2812554 RepID=UPI001966D193|nr:DUF2752 domain-containing protein [Nocardioides sp. SYSU D00038]
MTLVPPAAPAPATAPPGPRARWDRVRGPALTIGGLALATVALHLRDPHEQGSWGLCPSAALGLSCPGCGGLRAVNDLTHGRVLDAASSNLLLVVLLPFAVAGLGLWFLDRWHGRRRRVPPALRVPLAVGAVAVVLAFTVLRNLAAGAWLAP